MKDLVQIWNQVANRRYSSVNTDRELKDLSQNRLKNIDIAKSAFELNYTECEGLNNKFDDIDFNDKKDAIINRLFERRKKGQLTRQPKCLFLLLMLGFFALTAGCFILFAHPYDYLFHYKIVLQDGGEIFEMWQKPEVELYTKVYLFNITNAVEYMAGVDDKLKVKEIGPYVYRELLEHEVVSFNPNGTLSAVPKHPLTWVEELSEGNKEDDVLFLPHIALLSIANVVSQKDFVTRFGLNNLITLTNSQPLAKMTAKEFMMGYKSDLMTLGNTFLPGWIYFDKLGLIDRMYDFNGDFETVFTGENDISNSGLIDTYRGSTDLPQWEGKHCSNVQYASDGTKFKGEIERNESILFYRKSLCRAAPLVPVEEGVKSGMIGYKYTFPEHMMDNGKYIEDNKCFCRRGKCLPAGMIDVADCYYGFPIALSYPHFYQGEEVLFSKVEGLTPNKEQHETRFWIEPKSGLPLDVSSKFQINMALGDISNIKNSERFVNMYLPLLWFDIRMHSLPPSMEQRFKMYLNILPVVEQGAMYILFITGACLILLTIYILTFKIMFKSFEKQPKDLWPEKLDADVYSPCEIPLNESDVGERRSMLKLNQKLNETLGCVRGKIADLSHGKNLFGRKNSLQSQEQKDTRKDLTYLAVNQLESDDDCKYLEVVDDGAEFDQSDDQSLNKPSDHSRDMASLNTFSNLSNKLKELDEGNSQLVIQISP